MSRHACILLPTQWHMRFLAIIPHSTKKHCQPTYEKLLVKGWLQVRLLSLWTSSIWEGGVCLCVCDGGWSEGSCWREDRCWGWCLRHRVCECFIVVSRGGIHYGGVVHWLSVREKSVRKLEAGRDSWTGIGWLSMASKEESREEVGRPQVVTAWIHGGDN